MLPSCQRCVGGATASEFEPNGGGIALRLIAALVAFIAGIGLSAQVGMNRTLGGRMNSPILATLTSFAIGTTALLVYVLVTRPPLPARASLGGGPWWIWCGGLVGAAYLTAAAALSGRLGAATWFGLIVTGQIFGSLVMDHYGIVGFPKRPITPTKILGAVLLLVGVALVLRPGAPGEVAKPDAAADMSEL